MSDADRTAAQARTLFITGTDTGAGKTRAACALLLRARADGLRACGYKPVASGCVRDAQGAWRNDDALALIAASADSGAAYAQVNPYAFEPPVAPHLAARAAGVRVQLSMLDAAHAALARDHELVVAEGAGGWLVPLNEDLSFASWVERHNWPVILVVGMKLGCLNHALLSVESITRRTRLAGWIANVLPPRMDLLDENLAELRERIAAPLLGVIAEHATPEQAALTVQLPAFDAGDEDDEGLP